MPFFSKTVTELTYDDLCELLGSPESDRLEYKRDAYGRSDDPTREMLRDISSMANHVGGRLLIGVDEDQEGAVTLRKRPVVCSPHAVPLSRNRSSAWISILCLSASIGRYSSGISRGARVRLT